MEALYPTRYNPIESRKSVTGRTGVLTEDKDCEICYEPLEATGKGIEAPCWLTNCQCVYHTECLKNNYLYCIKKVRYPIRCPNYECEKIIKESDIERLVSKEDFEKYRNSFEKWLRRTTYAGFTDCPNTDCDYYFHRVD